MKNFDKIKEILFVISLSLMALAIFLCTIFVIVSICLSFIN